MFMSTKKARAQIEAALIEGKEAYIESLQSWHKKYAARQAELEGSFKLDSISKFSVNVWDDYRVEDGTYAYVEMKEVPDNVCFDVLNHVLTYAKSNTKIKSLGLQLGMKFHDSSEFYPTLIGREDGEYCLYKRWQLAINGANYIALEKFVELLKGVPMLSGKSIAIYSES